MTSICPSKGLGTLLTIKFVAWHKTKNMEKSLSARESSHGGQNKPSLAMIKHLYGSTEGKCIED